MRKVAEKFFIGFGLIAAPLMAWDFFSNEPEERFLFAAPAEQADRTPDHARAACITYIRTQLLHDPGSAEWVGRTEWPVTVEDDGTAQVLVTYRANNAFGALVRESGICRARPDGDRMRAYRLDSL